MKLGASATSPGVTARWVGLRNCVGFLSLGSAARGGLGCVSRTRGMWHCWLAWDAPSFAAFRHRHQAKRAVEAAVSQALREAEQ